jgi:signal transduction histidine kinase
VALVDPRGRFMAFNDRFLSLYLIDPGKAYWGMSFDELAALFGDLVQLPEDHRRVEVERRRAFATDNSRGRIQRRLMDGRTLDVTKNPLPAGGCVLTIRDITDVLRREQQLISARDQAEESNRMKSEFLARITHELRTPLNGLLGMMSILSNTDLDERQRSYLDVSATSGKVLKRLVDDILDLTQIEAQSFDLEREVFDLRRVLADCVAMTEPQAIEKGLQLVRSLPDQAIPPLVGDPVRLKQIVLNLLTNAIKFTEAGSVRLAVSGSADDGGYDMHIRVIDTGVGIPGDELTSIFSQYYKVEVAGGRGQAGAGLGLAIVQRLVDAMDGVILVTSNEGTGSEFSVQLTLPIAD